MSHKDQVLTRKTTRFPMVPGPQAFGWNCWSASFLVPESKQFKKQHPRFDLLGEEADDPLCALDHFLQVADVKLSDGWRGVEETVRQFGILGNMQLPHKSNEPQNGLVFKFCCRSGLIFSWMKGGNAQNWILCYGTPALVSVSRRHKFEKNNHTFKIKVILRFMTVSNFKDIVITLR